MTDWTDAWMKGEPPAVATVGAWLRARPLELRPLMIRFPPSCLVRAKLGVRLMVPAPGVVGIVSSYLENGHVTVRESPTSALRAECDPNDLEVVGYWRGVDSAWVAHVLADA